MVAEDALLKDVSRFGRYQLLQLLLFFFSIFSTTSQVLSVIFTAQTPDFRCDADGAGDNESRFLDANISNICLTNGSCPSPLFSEHMRTVVTKYNLVCDRVHLVPLISTLYMVGFFFGGTIYGYVSDRVGRRQGCLFSGLHTIICSVIAVFAPNYWMYVVFRLLTAVGASGQLAVTLTYAAECASDNNRALLVTICETPWSFCLFVLCLISYYLPDQTHLELICAAFSLFCIAIFAFCFESPRWLLSQGRKDETKDVLEKIAAVNKLQLRIDEEEFQEWILSKFAQEDDATTEKASMKDLLVYPGMRRLSLSLWFIIATVALVYYGFFFGISSLHGLSMYVQVMIGAGIEFVINPCLFPILKRCERLWLRIMIFILVGVFTLIVCVLISDPSMSLVVTVLCSIARPFGGFLFNIEVLYGVEIYPTTHRTLGIGSSNAAARLGSILATQLVTLGVLWKPAPYILITACCGVVILLTLFLPESKHHPCPETIGDAEKMIKEHMFYREQLCCQRRSEVSKRNIQDIDL